MHPLFNPLFRLAGDTEMLDAVSQFIGIGHVLGFDIGNTFGVGALQLQRYTEGNGAQDGEFMGRVNAVYIEGGAILALS